MRVMALICVAKCNPSQAGAFGVLCAGFCPAILVGGNCKREAPGAQSRRRHHAPCHLHRDTTSPHPTIYILNCSINYRSQGQQDYYSQSVFPYRASKFNVSEYAATSCRSPSANRAWHFEQQVSQRECNSLGDFYNRVYI